MLYLVGSLWNQNHLGLIHIFILFPWLDGRRFFYEVEDECNTRYC
jgi:hypothetical protein